MFVRKELRRAGHARSIDTRHVERESLSQGQRRPRQHRGAPHRGLAPDQRGLGLRVPRRRTARRNGSPVSRPLAGGGAPQRPLHLTQPTQLIGLRQQHRCARGVAAAIAAVVCKRRPGRRRAGLVSRAAAAAAPRPRIAAGFRAARRRHGCSPLAVWLGLGLGLGLVLGLGLGLGLGPPDVPMPPPCMPPPGRP